MAPNAKRFRNCIGPRLRELRVSRKHTQEQLAAHLQLAGLHTWDRVAVAKVESRIRGREAASQDQLSALLKELEERIGPLLDQGARVRIS